MSGFVCSSSSVSLCMCVFPDVTQQFNFFLILFWGVICFYSQHNNVGPTKQHSTKLSYVCCPLLVLGSANAHCQTLCCCIESALHSKPTLATLCQEDLCVMISMHERLGSRPLFLGEIEFVHQRMRCKIISSYCLPARIFE